MRRPKIAGICGIVLLLLLVVGGQVASAAPTWHVSAVIPLSVNPTGVGFTNGSAWVTLDAAGVARIDPATNEVTATIPVGNFPVRAIGGFGSVWVSNCGDGSVSRIDPNTNRVVATIATGVCPFDLGVLDQSLWVVNADNHVSRIDPATNSVIATVTAHLSECPRKCDFRGLTTGAGAVWVTTARTSVLRIDPATNQVTATIKLGPCCDTLRGVAVGFGSVWAADDGGNGVIARIDVNTLAVTALIPSVQANPSEITIFDKLVWIGHDSDTHSIIEAINPATNQTSAAVQVDDFAGSVVGGAGTVWTNSYLAMKVFRISR
jgi:YVTN family beta-propeller protein